MGNRSRVVLSLFVLLFGMSRASAEDFRLPSFLPGDTVSSDFFNDIMRKLEESKKAFTKSFLQGSWECDAYGEDTSYATNDWVSNGIVSTDQSVIVFEGNSLSASTINPFSVLSAHDINTSYEIAGNLLMFKNKIADTLNSFSMIYQLSKVSESKIILINIAPSNVGAAHLICDKQLLPPRPPSDLTATVDKKTVSLTWTDNSSDETSFSIRRKDSVDGSWSEVGSVSADTTSYSDAVTSSGRYWYRIFATNENGDSMGSNVIKIEVE